MHDAPQNSHREGRQTYLGAAKHSMLTFPKLFQFHPRDRFLKHLEANSTSNRQTNKLGPRFPHPSP